MEELEKPDCVALTMGLYTYLLIRLLLPIAGKSPLQKKGGENRKTKKGFVNLQIIALTVAGLNGVHVPGIRRKNSAFIWYNIQSRYSESLMHSYMNSSLHLY